MEQQAPAFWVNILPIAAIVAIFYFTMIRPQQKQEAARKKMLDALDKGDKVLTSGGITGVVHAVKGDEVEIKIADNVRVNVLRSYIITVLKDGAPAPVNPQS
ncbi:MAG: preprotein translocase subunit YajC [Elusimicrobiales bacterium]